MDFALRHKPHHEDRFGLTSILPKLLILLVGEERFERPTPCAQGSRCASKGSIAYDRFLIFTTTWGICFSLKK